MVAAGRQAFCRVARGQAKAVDAPEAAWLTPRLPRRAVMPPGHPESKMAEPPKLTRIKPAWSDVKAKVAAACLALVLVLLPLEEDESSNTPLFEAGLPEGACSTVVVNRYERNPVNRAACIAAHGSKCKVCGFDFGAVYGPMAHGYIEVHHRVPVSKMRSSYRIDPVIDLIPLCANCHAAVHRVDPPMEPETLVAILAKGK